MIFEKGLRPLCLFLPGFSYFGLRLHQDSSRDVFLVLQEVQRRKGACKNLQKVLVVVDRALKGSCISLESWFVRVHVLINSLFGNSTGFNRHRLLLFCSFLI